MDIDNARDKTTTSSENLIKMDYMDDNDTIGSTNDGGHREHDGVIRNKTIENNIIGNSVVINKEGIIGNNRVTEIVSNEKNAENMKEFVVHSKEEKLSDPITADDIEDSNVIILGSVLPSTEKTVKSVRKRNSCKLELIALGITDLKEEEDEFDVYAGSDRTYRKYRLRQAAKPDYRIPTSIDPTPNEEAKIKARRPSDEVFQCGKCNRRFFTNFDLRSHYRMVHVQKYTCSLCSQEFKSNNELVSHKKIHKEEKQCFICHGCKLAFSDHCDFRLHELTHEKPNKIFKCPECGMKYNKRSYEAHIPTHFDTYKPCPICDKKVRSNHLTYHINQHSVKHECVECGRILKTKKDYEEHMAIHTGVKRHQCLYCGKGFRLSGQKKVHTRIHTQEKLYACSVCDKKFIQSTDMMRHVERHHGTGKKECNICMKKVWDMRLHMKVHTAEKRFKCSECGKGYLTVNGLKSHMVFTHSMERPFRCQSCDMAFANEQHLRRHKLSKTHKRNVYKTSLKEEDS